MSSQSQKADEYLIIHGERYKTLLNIIEQLKLPERSKILDVGCYPLHIFNKLKSRGYDMFGIASEHEKVDQYQIVVTNIEKDKLPYKANTFELIIFTEVIEHMTANPDQYMKEFLRVLKPSGKLIITTPNSVNLKNRMKLLMGQSVYFPLFQLYETTPDNGFMYHRHTREFTLDELKEVVSHAGFGVYSAKQYSAYTPFRKERAQQQTALERMFKYVGYFITLLSPSLKDSLLVVAQK